MSRAVPGEPHHPDLLPDIYHAPGGDVNETARETVVPGDGSMYNCGMSRPGAKGKSGPIYRVIFRNQDSVYKIHARKVSQGELYTFVEVEEILFGERGGVLVDPSEERLKSEFAGVRRTYIPLQAVVRIDEVEKEGVNKILPVAGSPANVTPFPVTVPPPGGRSGKG